MTNAQKILKQSIRFYRGIAFLTVVLLSVPLMWAQYPLQYPANSQVTMDGTAILVEDYAKPPLASALGDHAYPPPIDYKGMLARVNTLRSEPANAPLASTRFFVADMNGNLYTLNKATKKFTAYINFPEIFPKYATDRFGSGVSAIVFDPNYAKNGKFYTVHVEDPAKPGSSEPTNAHMPSLKLDGYATTPAVKPPAGDDQNESVLVQSPATNVKNSPFSGPAPQILRAPFHHHIHP